MASSSVSRWTILCLLAAMLLFGAPARANAESGPFSAYWEAPSEPGAEDGWTVGLLFPKGGEEPRFLLAAGVSQDRFHPLDFITGPIHGFLFDPADKTGDPLYSVEGSWWIDTRILDPLGGGELRIYDLEGKPLGRMSFSFREFTWIEGEWEILK